MKDKITDEKIVDILTDELRHGFNQETIAKRNGVSRQAVHQHKQDNREKWDAETDRLFPLLIREAREDAGRAPMVELPTYRSTAEAIEDTKVRLMSATTYKEVLERYLKYLQEKQAKQAKA